jgi:hypothetical protein
MKLKSLLLAAALSFSTAYAHHGQSFILVEDTQCACCDDRFLFLTNFEWERGADGSEFGASPAVFVGINNWMSFSLEADFRDEVGADWKYSSVTPAFHFSLIPMTCNSPINVGISAGYQFGTGEEFEDGPSIHAHGVDAFVGRLIIDGNITSDLKAVFNLLNVAGPGTAWGYAAGLRQKVSDQFSVGIEGMGDFKKNGWQELVGGLYIQPTHALTLKVGVGFGLNETTPDFTLRTGLILRF